ncbi:hypothetical protein C9426_09760 [Serratia sp. S1B]|nr:hypothetical protein C9426_09760 [Serratia sp. S1B]
MLSWRYVGLLLLGFGGMGSLCLTARAADSVNVSFAAEFVAPTCTMKVPSTVNFTSNGSALQSSELTGEGVTVPGGVEIIFSDCSNQSFASAIPQIVVTGRTVQLGGSDYYFADAPTPATPANGYGVKLSVSGQPLFQDNSNIAVTGGVLGGGVIRVKTGNTVASLNGTALNLTAQLSCGSYSPCSDAPAHEVGAFKATVTFQLAYD